MLLSELEDRLTLFVEGMHGSYLHLRPREAFAGTADLGVFSAQAADTVYLPAELVDGGAAGYRVLAMRQVAQRLFGTYEFRLAPMLAAHPTLGDQVPEGGSLRLGELERLRRHYRFAGLFQWLFEVLEVIRLDACTVRAFPGLCRPLRAQLESSSQLLLDPDTLPPPLLSQQFQRWCEDHWARLDPDHMPTGTTDETSLVDALHNPAADVYRSVLLADQCYKALPLEALDATLAELPEGREAESDLTEAGQTSGDWLERDARLKDWQEELAALEGMLLDPDFLLDDDAEVGNRPGLDGSTRPEGQHLDQQVDALERERDQLSRRIDQERAAIRHALGAHHAGSRSYRYPEWDCFENRYLPAWCTLYELPIEPIAEEDPQSLAQSVRRWRDEIRQRLAQVRPLGLQRRRGLEDGDELDFNALLDARLDSAAGLAPDEAVYSRRERVQRDLSAAFLVDLSASTDDPIDPPAQSYEEPTDWDDPRSVGTLWADDPPPAPTEDPRRIIDVLREAMLAMASALEQLGDEYGVYGFSGYGRDQVEFYVAKELGAAFTPRTLHRIASMKPRRSTRMGPAIRHATEKLKRSGHQLKLLVMLSDGFPQDCDYGPTRGDHEYGLEDTAQALAEAAAAGVRTFCITVDKSGNDYLKQMCRDAQYLVIDDVEELPAALGKVYRSLSS